LIPKNILRRIKQNLYAKEHSFFAVVQPGFETTSEEEIKHIVSSVSVTARIPGGIEFSCKVDDIWKLNLASHTVTRFLMRIDSFRALYFERFRERMARIPWEIYLSPSAGVNYSISCHTSRLYHTGRLEEESCSAVAESMRKIYPDWNGTAPAPEENNPVQTVFIRFEDDTCSVSIDTSGEPLYRRGYRTFVEKAPLRETFAASILLYSKIFSFDALVDPMCGSGVFSLEAALMVKGVLPGARRVFAFQSWPGYSSASYEYMKKTLQKESSAKTIPFKIYASDSDDKAVVTAGRNFEDSGMVDVVTLAKKDFFTIGKEDFSGKKILMVLNPPYGKRIPVEKTAQFYKRIFEHIDTDFAGSTVFVLVPSEIVRKTVIRTVYVVLQCKNGGISLSLVRNNT
jgi:putative N6-adenine-specific DNA methylase